MEPLASTFKNIGITRLIIITTLLMTMGWFAIYMTQRLSTPEMGLLYSDLDVGDAGRIVAKLEDRGIPVQIGGGGTQVFVPADMVARLRMDMAEAGLPSGGSVGYEIFDRGDLFGTSFFIQNVNHIRALEGELARTIRTINQVASARVHLVLPKKEVFSRDQQEPSASIVLRLNSPGALGEERVHAIQHLVAAAVPGLSAQRVSIVDDRGNLLSAGDNSNEAVSFRRSEEQRVAYQKHLERSIETLLEKSLGPGKVRAEVLVDMDFDRLTENSETFDPDGQIARSTQTVQEANKGSEAGGGDISTATLELPEGPEGAVGGGQNSNESNRTEETVNYEISKTMRTLIREGGQIKRLSVAVLVDGVSKAGAEGSTENAYTPRSQEEMQKLEKLVRSVVGFKEDRGDKVEIINMPFAQAEATPEAKEESPLFGLEQHQLVRLVETFILALMGILGLLLVVKPLMSRVMEAISAASEAAAASGPQMLMVPAGKVAGPADSQNLALPGSGDEASFAGKGEVKPKVSELDKMIDLKQVEGQVRASSLSKVSEIIDKHPDETVAILRTWMNQ